MRWVSVKSCPINWKCLPDFKVKKANSTNKGLITMGPVIDATMKGEGIGGSGNQSWLRFRKKNRRWERVGRGPTVRGGVVNLIMMKEVRIWDLNGRLSRRSSSWQSSVWIWKKLATGELDVGSKIDEGLDGTSRAVYEFDGSIRSQRSLGVDLATEGIWR